MAAEKKTFAEMAGEFFREASVLVGVFGWLDSLIEDKLSAEWAAVTVLLMALLLAIGMLIEWIR
ncbi:MAG: hypothetical protein HY720_18820 [Planctomycetes bacterium]|nr:hypothetical protein [Planctomycetota bacterium]